MGVRVDTFAGCANPIILSDLCFTLEMATFEMVTQHLAWIFIFNIPPNFKIFPTEKWKDLRSSGATLLLTEPLPKYSSRPDFLIILSFSMHYL